MKLDQVLRLPKFNKILLLFKIFPGSKRKVDTANVISVTEKFFCDVLVNQGKIKDDDYKHVLASYSTFGKIVEPEDERVEVTIFDVGKTPFEAYILQDNEKYLLT